MSDPTDSVILLHGLARTSRSMWRLATAFKAHGYQVVNVNYPSRKMTVEALSEYAVSEGLAHCDDDENTQIHFVTHSMGGILIRHYLSQHPIAKLGRVVMLAPPNQGCEIVDELVDKPGFQLVNGVAGTQMGTDKQSVPMQLGAVTYPVGIIAGDRSINPVLARYVPEPNDGKVSVESTQVEGMADFIQIPASHSFIMLNETAIKQALTFIETGQFIHQTD